MRPKPSIVWFRQDLRLADNPALVSAVERGGAVIPLFIWAPEDEGAWAPGGASHWWLQQSLARLDLDHGEGVTSGLESAWRPGSQRAGEQLERFLYGSISSYNEDRGYPARLGTSRLSPHIHFGEISPRQLWHSVKMWADQAGGARVSKEADAYLRQLGWREFAYYLLSHFPHTAEAPLRLEFEAFPWRVDEESLQAWKEGMTGYSLVDAGMRELRETGWMHNRVRMVVASFLVKDLLIPWFEGARWFWENLVDADLANNTLGWQWVAGCGADAAPFFRIFNPVKQGEKFDSEGRYVRKWVPELAGLSGRWIHKPWEAPSAALKEAGIRLGRTYPIPIVDHKLARGRALAALARIRNK